MAKEPTSSIKCAKCGLENASDGKFCSHCGARLKSARAVSAKGFEGLAFLHFTGAVYLIVTAAANTLVHSSWLFLVPYLLFGVLGLVVGWQVWSGRWFKGWTKSLSLITIIISLIITVAVYVISLISLDGLIGPGWIIFGFSGWALLRAWRKL
jgi:hypothetical protein